MEVISGNPDGKRPLERPRCRWVDNEKMHAGGEGLWVWTDVAQDGG
jgi:hypothetical protein